LTIFVTFTLFLWSAHVTPESYPSATKQEDRFAILSYIFTGLSSILVDLRFDMGGAGLAGIFGMLPWIVMGWLKTEE